MNAHQWGFENYSSFIPRRKRLGYRKVISTWDTTRWLQAPAKAPRIQPVLKTKYVSGESRQAGLRVTKVRPLEPDTADTVEGRNSYRDRSILS